jgi:transketolase
MIDLETVAELAAQLRVDSVRCTTAAGSGHPTSSMSAADLMAVLITRHRLDSRGCPLRRARTRCSAAR